MIYGGKDMYDYSSGNKENVLFAFVSCLVDFAKVSYEEGVAFLQEDIVGYPQDVLLFRTMQKVTDAIITGVSLEEIIAMVSSEYRQESEVEREFILISTKAIYYRISWARLERCLLQKLTMKERNDYLRYWKQSVSERMLGYFVARRRRGV